jgi:GDP-L-fucose synthase
VIPLDTRIFVAGHRGLVGSALVRRLQADGPRTLLLRTHDELDLCDARAADDFFRSERPAMVLMAAARVGGILANARQPYAFIHDNLAMASHVIDAARRHGVQRLLFLGSSCIYPRLAEQPLTESALLTGPLEPTNRPYALAKIAGIELCWSSNRQHGTRFLAAMPCNLYGEGDTYHPEHSHVIPGLLRRLHEARQNGDREVTVWGSGEPRREFLHCDDMADACVHLMSLPDAAFDGLLGGDPLAPQSLNPPLVNIGSGEDLTIAELATRVARAVGFDGTLRFDRSKPDGTPRKLLHVGRLRNTGWAPRIGLDEGLWRAYRDFQSRFTSD